MATTTEELVAIIGGSLAGLIVLLIVLACIIHYACGKRRHDPEKDSRRFRQLSANIDTGISKHNGPNGYDPRMDVHAADPRLPKVGSSGLWLGAPSMYSKGPSDAYYIESRPQRNSSLQRASSETRLAGTPHGHMVYQGNMQPIYHSQQMPGVYQPYEMAPHRSSYMQGLYQYPYGQVRDSRAILVEYPDEQQYYYNYRRAEEDKRPNAKVKRTHSDLTGTKRKKERKRRESPSFSREKDIKPRTASVEVHKQRNSSKTRESSSQTRSKSQTRESFTPSEEQSKTMEFKDQEINTESITDSAKLRAIQGTSKDTEFSNKWKDSDDLKLNLPTSDDEEDRLETSVQIQRYSYEGKMTSPSQQYESSLVSKMDALVDDNSNGVVRAVVGAENKGQINPAFTPDEIRSTSTTRMAVPETSKVEYHDEVPLKRKVEKAESNADGKQVTAAFDFLNNYLSDDEGTEHFESRNQSPLPFA